MNTNTFVNNFLGGTRGDLFEVWIKYPEKLKQYMIENAGNLTATTALGQFFGGETNVGTVITNAANTLFSPSGSRLYVKKAKIPKFGVGTEEVQYKGRKFDYPTTREDDKELQLAIYNDVHYLHHSVLVIWTEFIRTTQTNIGLYPDQIFGEIKVFQHDSLGNVLKIVNFTNAFVKSVDGMDLDWSSESIQEFNANFGYHFQLTDTSDEILL